VLPERLRADFASTALFVPGVTAMPAVTERLALLRPAVRDRRRVRLVYERGDGTVSERTVRPLCLAFFAPLWLLSGFCELRQAFRSFRLDRMQKVDVLDEHFEQEQGRTLADFLAHVMAERDPDERD
ncbi:MAG: WYL domain-containing protein, partial [Pseudomonadota bacterium]